MKAALLKVKLWNTPGTYICLVILVVIPLLMLHSNRSKPRSYDFKVEKRCYKHGDNPNWSDPEWNTDDWSPLRFLSDLGMSEPDAEGPIWLRYTIDFSPNEKLFLERDLKIQKAASCDFDYYWDGVLLEQDAPVEYLEYNGKSLVTKQLIIPSKLLTKGKHQVAIRYSEQKREGGPLFHYASLGGISTVFWGSILFQVDDDPTYCTEKYDDKEWIPIDSPYISGAKLPTERNQTSWIRFSTVITRPISLPDFEAAHLYICTFGPHEVYWDGELVGTNGSFSDTGEPEDSGTYLNFYKLSEHHLQQGRHKIAIRFAQKLKNGESSYIDAIGFRPVAFMIRSSAQGVFKYAVPLGIILTNALFFLLYFFINERRRAYLILSGFYFMAALYLAVIQSSLMMELPVDWIFGRTLLKNVILIIAGVLLINFHVVLFSLPAKKKWAIISFLSVVIIAAYNLYRLLFDLSDSFSESMLFYLFSSIPFFCFSICVYAVAKDRKGAWWALLGISFVIATLIGVMITKMNVNGNPGLYIPFVVHTVCLIVSTLVEGREFRKNHRKTKEKQSALQLTKTRLELELIKKNIQPHLMMNTLTSLTEWIERNPQQSVHFIEALADELRLASELSSETFITIDQEIEVCKSYLKLMSFQENRNFQLTVDTEFDADVSNVLVPPYILHTLVENGVTHNDYSKLSQDIEFTLKMSKEGQFILLRLNTPLGRNRSRKKNTQQIPSAIQQSHGSGIKYVKARLDECYKDDWKFEDGAKNQCWETTILIPAPQNNGRVNEEN